MRWRGLWGAWMVVAALAAASAVVAAPSSFGDVDRDEWYTGAVEWLVDEGLTTGVSPGCFDPDGVLTRGQAAAFLYRLAGGPAPQVTNPFVDVNAGWQVDAVAWLAQEGITNGIAPNRFGPQLPLTRAQFAALLYRYAGRPEALAHPFDDVPAGWQSDAVSWLFDAGITNGTGLRRFSPDDFVTRAQLATFLYRYAGASTAKPPEADAPDEPVVCRQSLVVHGTGDVNFDPGYGPNPQRPFADAWTGLDGMFGLDDLTIINLECVPSLLGTAVPKTYNFRCPLEALAPSRAAGIDVANQANNHSADYGIEALLNGAGNIAAHGIAPVGVGIDLAAATTPAIIEQNGWTIAVLGFNRIGSGSQAALGRAGIAPGDVETMTAAVRAAAADADLVFVTIHWGIESTFTPAADDVAAAHAMIDAGADAIFGHHPHRLQPLEFYKGRPIFWSLGNFVWQSQDRSRNTAIGRVMVGADGSFEASLIPVDIAAKGHPVLVGS